MFALSLIANGILLVAMFNTSWLPLIVALSVPAGITVIGWFVVAQTLLQKWVPDRYRGRVFGAYEATQALMMLVGMGLGVALEDLLGVVVVLSLVGCLGLGRVGFLGYARRREIAGPAIHAAIEPRVGLRDSACPERHMLLRL